MRDLPITVPVTKEEFNRIYQLQTRFRWDWPVVFSANSLGHIWSFVTYGYTREKDRLQLRGASELLDYVADEYVAIRPEGGRFFIDEEGVCFNDSNSNKILLAEFLFIGSFEPSKRIAVKPLGPGRTVEQGDRHDDRVCDEDVCPFCADERLRNFGIGI